MAWRYQRRRYRLQGVPFVLPRFGEQIRLAVFTRRHPATGRGRHAEFGGELEHALICSVTNLYPYTHLLITTRRDADQASLSFWIGGIEDRNLLFAEHGLRPRGAITNERGAVDLGDEPKRFKFGTHAFPFALCFYLQMPWATRNLDGRLDAIQQAIQGQLARITTQGMHIRRKRLRTTRTHHSLPRDTPPYETPARKNL